LHAKENLQNVTNDNFSHKRRRVSNQFHFVGSAKAHLISAIMTRALKLTKLDKVTGLHFVYNLLIYIGRRMSLLIIEFVAPYVLLPLSTVVNCPIILIN
jgi:hypothetical protein